MSFVASTLDVGSVNLQMMHLISISKDKYFLAVQIISDFSNPSHNAFNFRILWYSNQAVLKGKKDLSYLYQASIIVYNKVNNKGFWQLIKFYTNLID